MKTQIKNPHESKEKELMARMERFKAFVADALAEGMYDEMADPVVFMAMALETFTDIEAELDELDEPGLGPKKAGA